MWQATDANISTATKTPPKRGNDVAFLMGTRVFLSTLFYRADSPKYLNWTGLSTGELLVAFRQHSSKLPGCQAKKSTNDQ